MGWVDRLVAERVVVHTDDGRSIRGFLQEVQRHELVLRRAEYLLDGGPQELEGEVGIPRERISFIQCLNGSEKP